MMHSCLVCLLVFLNGIVDGISMGEIVRLLSNKDVNDVMAATGRLSPNMISTDE